MAGATMTNIGNTPAAAGSSGLPTPDGDPAPVSENKSELPPLAAPASQPERSARHWTPVTDLATLIAGVSRLLDQGVEQAFDEARIDLTAGKLRALKFIMASDGARQSEIAMQLGVEPMTMSSYVDKLERGKLVTRVAEQADKRVRLVRASEHADALVDAVDPIVSELCGRMTRGLTNLQVEALRRALAIVARNMKCVD